MVRQAHYERVCFLQGYKKKENALKEKKSTGTGVS